MPFEEIYLFSYAVYSLPKIQKLPFDSPFLYSFAIINNSFKVRTKMPIFLAHSSFASLFSKFQLFSLTREVTLSKHVIKKRTNQK